MKTSLSRHLVHLKPLQQPTVTDAVWCVSSGELSTRSMLPPRCYCRMSWDPSLDLIPYVSDIY